MDERMCMERYNRKARRGSVYADLYCHFPRGHGTDTGHSWAVVYEMDTEVLDPTPPAMTTDSTAAFATTVCGMLDDGELDPYIEQILASGHNRKRALRGVRGFGRGDRAR